MKILIILIMFFIPISNIYSAGHSDYFLDVGISASAIGMGRASVTEGDISSIYWNPGALSQVDQLQISSNYTRLYSDVKCYSIAFGIPQEHLQRGFLDISFLKLSAGDIEFRDEQNNLNGKFDDTHQSVLLSYGHCLYEKNNVPIIGLGFTGKYISQEMLGNKRDVCDMDCGLIISPFSKLKLGLNCKNVFNSKMNGKFSSEKLPQRRVVGINLKLSEKTAMAVDYEKMLNFEQEEFRFGMKINAGPGYEVFGFRIGHEKEEYSLKSFSIGFGLLGRTPISVAYEFYFRDKKGHKEADFSGGIISVSFSYFGLNKGERSKVLKNRYGKQIKNHDFDSAKKIITEKRIFKPKKRILKGTFKDDIEMQEEFKLLEELSNDKEKPEVSYTITNAVRIEEENLYLTNESSLNIKIDASDNFGLSEVKISDITKFSWSKSRLSDKEEDVSGIYTVSDLKPGENKIKLEVRDLKGNKVEEIFEVKYDPQLPEIENININRHKLKIECSDNYKMDKIEIIKNRSVVRTQIFRDRPASCSLSLNLKRTISSSGDIIVKVFDLAGNSAEKPIYYDRAPPRIIGVWVNRRSRTTRTFGSGLGINRYCNPNYSLIVRVQDNHYLKEVIISYQSGVEIRRELNGRRATVTFENLNYFGGSWKVKVVDTQGLYREITTGRIMRK